MNSLLLSPVKHWAVLVGVNFYKRDKRDKDFKSLDGCVRDVRTMREYLETGPNPVDIAILTATKPRTPDLQKPSEEPEYLPTVSNLTDKLQRVLMLAKKGDFVYIHYSGHGTRIKSDEDTGIEHGIQTGTYLHLVLLHPEHFDDHYYPCRFLASCLRKMVDKGLQVTLVLDCCFSGNVFRGDDVPGMRIRYVDYNPSIKCFVPLESSTDFTSAFDSDPTFRDSALPSNQWLVNPVGYTILSACGPHETASEFWVPGTGARRGALSYFLMEALSTLRSRRVEATHESLYEQLRLNFRKSWPQQTPMRYGNSNLSFFGGAVTPSMSFVHVYTKGGCLYLNAGDTHGVHEGDQYTISPLHSTEDDSKVSFTTKVHTVNALTSILEPVEAHWQAKLVASVSHRKIPIQLPLDVADRLQQNRIQGYRYLSLHVSKEDPTACMFGVSLNDQGQYEIVDAHHQRVWSLPTVPSGAQGAESKLMDILQHVANFKYVEAIENKKPNAEFEDSFSLVSYVDGSVLNISGVINVRHEGVWHLKLTNCSKSDCLYMAIFGFTSSWKVENLLTKAGQGEFLIVEANDERDLPIQMTIPEFVPQSIKSCEDVFKVFITNKPTSFPSMILPEISSSHNHRGQDDEASDIISSLIENLSLAFRGEDGDKWASRNFIVTISR
ncbi:caspase domain-containing protein [Xylaria curta]|nr:caspase domain-containing protein [Xylaria curta]